MPNRTENDANIAEAYSHILKTISGGGIKGKSVLVVGAPPAEFCETLMAAGTSRIVAIDASPEFIDYVQASSHSNDTRPQYICADFNEWHADPQSCDIVVCLNGLQQSYDPIGTLRKMMRIARERIVMQIAIAHAGDIMRSKYGWRLLGALRSPLILMGGRNPIDASEQAFLFTKAALSKLFNGHTQAFEPLRFSAAPHRAHTIIEARRRRIDHLVVVAGVACVGKSRFIDFLTSSPQLKSRFGIGEGRIDQINAREVARLPAGELQTLIFHYDILRPHGRPFQNHRHDPTFHLLQCARRITVITLVQSRSVICERSASNDQPSARRKELARHYNKEGFLSLWYEAWFDSVAPFIKDGNASQLVFADDGYREIDRVAARHLLA